MLDDVNSGYLPEDLVLAARREEIDWVHSEGVYEIVSMQECRDAGMKPLDLWIRHARKFDRGCVQESTKRSVVWCGARLGTQKTLPCVHSKRPPCMPAPRAHVLKHVRVCAGTHGSVLNVHTGKF